MTRIALLLLAASAAGCALLPPSPRYEIVGYYPGWKGAIDIDARQLTVVNYAFLDICWDGQHGNASIERQAPCEGANGAVALDNPPADSANLTRLVEIGRAHV